MADILDLIAKVSWETNEAELTKVNSTLKQQDKLLEELRLRGRRLEEQLIKTNDPKRVTALNAELKKTMQSADAIVSNQKKQIELTQKLQNESKKLGDSIKTNINNPQATKGLLQQLHSVYNQLSVLGNKAQSLPSKFGGLGQALMGGLGIGAGAFGAEAIIQNVVGFFDGAIDEILEAEKSTRDLGLALEAIGKKNYLGGLIAEATELSTKFNLLYDNDEIAQAQTEFVKYGNVTRGELKALTEVSIELASKLGIDVVSASNKVIDILAGRGASTLRDFGISTKDAKTETERMNLVLVDLASKIAGASDAYAQSAEGIKKQNELIVANTKEQIGEKLMPIYIDMLQGINDILSGEAKKIGPILAGATEHSLKLLFPIIKDLQRLYRSIFEEEKDTNVVGNLKAFYKSQYDIRSQVQRESNKKMAQEREREEQEESKKAEESTKKKIQKVANVAKSETKKKENRVNFNIDLMVTPPSGVGSLSTTGDFKANAEKAVKDAYDMLNKLSDRAQAEAEFKAKRKSEKQRKKDSDLDLLMSNINAVSYETNAIIDLEQKKTDKLIELQERRIESARNSSTASLKIEQDRLNALLEKRRKYERAQRVIDAGVIVANQAVAISGAIKSIASSTTVVEKVANVLALVAGIAASITAVRNAFQDTGFKEGGYTGDGNPNEKSTKIGRKPYTYHKGEFVMDAGLTNENRDLFEGLHKRKLSVKRLNDGSYYLTPDVYKISSDYENSKTANSDIGLLNEMKSIKMLLQAREVNIQNNFDAEGFGQSVATQLGYAQLKQKLR